MNESIGPSSVDEKCGHAMVKARLISEVQLKTVFDYQLSLGGSLSEVITKLGFSTLGDINRFLAESNLESPPSNRASTSGKKDLDSGVRELKEGNLPTERRESSPMGRTTHLGRRDDHGVLDALIALLVHKGVITTQEEAMVLRAGAGSLSTKK